MRAREALLRLCGSWSPTEAQRTLAVTLLAGAASGVLAVAFHSSIQVAERLLIGAAEAAPRHWWIVLTLACPTLGGVIAGLALTYAFPAATGSGIPQVKAAYAAHSERLRLRDGVAKFALTVLQIGSGASLGREGPTVHICAAFSGALGRWFSLSPRSVRRLLPLGAAAGVAAAFNAPIAAVTFAVEEILGTLDQTLLSGVVVAAALAAVIEHLWLGANPILAVPKTLGFQHLSSLPLYAVLGGLAGVVSIAFGRSLLGLREGFRSYRACPAWLKPGVGGFLTGACAVIGLAAVGARGVAGGGYAELGQALRGSLPIATLLALGVLKFGATLFSYSSGGTGGIFAPTLFMGAMLGGAVGWVGQHTFGHAELGEFALVGMGAVFAGVIRAPITSVLIVFEMTDEYALVLPLMIASTIAYLVAKRSDPRGLYDALLEQDGVLLQHGATPTSQLDALRVAHAMTTEVRTLAAELSVGQALVAVDQETFSAYPVVSTGDGRCSGIVELAVLRRIVAEGGAARWLSELVRLPAWVCPEDALTRAVVQMHTTGTHQVLVLNEQGGSLAGLVTMTDIVRTQARAAEGTAAAEPSPSTAA